MGEANTRSTTSYTWGEGSEGERSQSGGGGGTDDVCQQLYIQLGKQEPATHHGGIYQVFQMLQ